MQPRNKSFYDTWGNTLKQHLENCFPNIRVRTVGSRLDGTFGRDSDLDLQICFEGGQTTKETIYPRIVECLKGKLMGKYIGGETIIDVRMGGSHNVVNIFPQGGGKISFALESCDKFS